MDNDEEDAAHRLLLSHPKVLSLIFKKTVLVVLCEQLLKKLY